jgi:hypothetical protein
MSRMNAQARASVTLSFGYSPFRASMKALFRSFAWAVILLMGAFQQAGAAPSSALQPTGDSDFGFLDVSSEPSGAKILIDDADLGQTTPQHHLPVRAGHHRLTLVASDGARKLTVGFTVDAGQTKKLTLYLAK